MTPISRDRPLTAEQLARYLAGTDEEGDREAVARWRAEDPERQEALARTARVLDAGLGAVPLEEVQESFARWQETLQQQAPDAGPAQKHIRHGFPRTGKAAILAAGLAMAGLVALPVMWQQRHSVSAEHTARRGERLKVTLPDGSHVVLAPETHLSYATGVQGARRIDVKGQAYFTVEHDPARPFIVTTGQIETHVLGTEFSVKRYAGDVIAEIAVVTGKVSTGVKGDQLVLTPGTVAEAGDSTSPQVISRDPRSAVAWVDGELTFTNTQVRVMLEILSRWCDYEFRLTDSTLGRGRVTTALSVNDPSYTIAALQDLLDVTVTVDGKAVTLSPRKKSQSMPSRDMKGKMAIPFTTATDRGR